MVIYGGGLKRSHRCTERWETPISVRKQPLWAVQKSAALFSRDLRDRSGILRVQPSLRKFIAFCKGSEKLRSEFVIAVTGRENPVQ